MTGETQRGSKNVNGNTVIFITEREKENKFVARKKEKDKRE